MFDLSFCESALSLETKDKKTIFQVAVDSRQCQQGSLFVALKGQKVEGESFLEEAAKNGAVAALVSKKYAKEDFGLTLLRVENTLDALQTLAKAYLKLKKPLVIGITGSIGKTTTKDYIASLLLQKFTVYQTPRSQNSQIGLALTILNANENAKVFVLEMGISYPSEMEKLIDMAPCDIAVVTRVAPAHIGHFSSLEHIAEEKSLLLKQKTVQKGFCFYLNTHFKAFQQIDSCDFYPQKEFEFEIPNLEKHQLENLSVAAMVSSYLGLSKEEIKKGAHQLKSPIHRYELKHYPTFPSTLFIDDSYNSNPIALKIALQSLKKYKNQRRVIGVIGEMKELGSLSKMAHRELGLIASFSLDLLFCFGEESKPLYESFLLSGKYAMHLCDKMKLCEILLKEIKENDVLFFKGSCSNALWECIDFLSDEKNVIKSFCSV